MIVKPTPEQMRLMDNLWNSAGRLVKQMKEMGNDDDRSQTVLALALLSLVDLQLARDILGANPDELFDVARKMRPGDVR